MRKCPQALSLATFLLFSGAAAHGQGRVGSANLPDTPTPKQAGNNEQQKPAEKSPLETSLGLIAKRSWFYPDLARTQRPLTSAEKFELFLDKSLSPPQILSSMAGAGIGQAKDSLHGYGQGADGYAKRFGSSMASGASSQFFGTFLLPTVLHDDPRFFVKMRGKTSVRVGNALRRVLVIRKDDGASAFNYPGTLGPLFAEGLANVYLPDGERTAGKTFQRFAFRLAWGAANNVVKEYWPTIFKSLRMEKVAPGLKPQPAPIPPS